MKLKKILVTLTVSVLLAFAGWGWSVWVRIYNNPPPYVVENGETSPRVVEDVSGKNILNILILGIDQLNNEPARADSIIVMSLNEDTKEMALISIPRDSRVEIPGHGLDKINHAMAYKGQIKLMQQTVEQLLGVPIHHYAYTNFTGFINIVDLLGGVKIDVQRRMIHEDVYNPINLYPGLQSLNGEQALGYVRFRGDKEYDFGRMKRQQEFLKVITAEVFETKNILVLSQLIEQAARHVRTDMSITQLINLRRILRNVDIEEMVSFTLQGRNSIINGLDYVILDEAHLEETVRNYLYWEDEDGIIKE